MNALCWLILLLLVFWQQCRYVSEFLTLLDSFWKLVTFLKRAMGNYSYVPFFFIVPSQSNSDVNQNWALGCKSKQAGHRWVIHWNICHMRDSAKEQGKIGTVYCVPFYRLCTIVKKAGKTNRMLCLVSRYNWRSLTAAKGAKYNLTQ